jgi:hypothetical protein
MSTEGAQLPDHPFTRSSTTQPEVATKVVPPDTESDIPLLEVEKLIRAVLAQPAPGVDSEVVALVRGAAKMHRNFQVSLALRALRLEQGLRKAQQEIIRLQWEQAQVGRFRLLPSPANEAED